MSLNTRQQLLSHAEQLIRTRGYSGFSYADLANQVGIRKASIHHHFSFKEKLGEEIIEDYIARFEKELYRIDNSGGTPSEQLQSFAKMFHASIDNGLLPLCGALAAEYSVLPESLQMLTKSFFSTQLAWIERKLAQLLKLSDTPDDSNLGFYAHLLLSALEGSSFIDWTTGSSEHLMDGFNLILGAIENLHGRST